MMSNLTKIAATALLLATVFTNGGFINAQAATKVAAADDNKPATGPAADRKNLMKSMAKNVKTMKKMFGGETTYDANAMQTAAKAVQSSLSDLVSHTDKLFAVGSTTGETDAKPNIWQKWDDFVKVAKSASEKADALVAAAGGDKAAAETAYKDLGDGCKSCHKDFRAEK